MDWIIVLLLILLINWLLSTLINNHDATIPKYFIWVLFGAHVVLTAAYMVYAALTASDSVAYYQKAALADNWVDLYETGTSFIQFVAWPLVKIIGLSYYATMFCFSFVGYCAILLFYMATKENVTLLPTWGKYTYTELLFLLPNLHFWSASLGKGSVILLGLALFAYGLSRFNRRILVLLIGGFLVYMVRPHIMFSLLLSIMLGMLLTSGGIKIQLRIIGFLLAAIIFWFINDSVLQFADLDSINILNSDAINHRAKELAKASSGVNIEEYGLLAKLFTFWFRPLFIDSGGLIGLLASFENVIYVVMFVFISKQLWLHFKLFNGWFKIGLVFFIAGSLILAQISGNLGIAMRQKAQVIPFFFILFCKAFALYQTHQKENHG